MVVCWYFFLLTNFHLLSLSYGRLGLGLWHLVWISLLGPPCPSNAALLGGEEVQRKHRWDRMQNEHDHTGQKEPFTSGCGVQREREQTHDRLSSKPVSTGCLAPSTWTREPQCCPGLSSRRLTRDATCTYMGRSTSSGRKVARRHHGVFWVVNAQVAAALCPTLPRGLPNPCCLPRKTLAELRVSSAT